MTLHIDIELDKTDHEELKSMVGKKLVSVGKLEKESPLISNVGTQLGWVTLEFEDDVLEPPAGANRK